MSEKFPPHKPKEKDSHLAYDVLNHCPRCGSGRTVCPIEAQRPMMLCTDCGLQFNLAHLVRLN
jgi:hypothetical protein